MAGTLNDAAIRKLIAAVSAGAKAMCKPDSSNLYLQVRPTGGPNGSASWIFRYQIGGRRREMGLGSYPTVSASKARLARDELKILIRSGVDPLDQRDAIKARTIAEREQSRRRAITFAHCMHEFIAAKQHEWSNPKHRSQWVNTLTTYALPILGDVPVTDVTTEHVLRVVNPIWHSRTETAKRLLGRIERIVDYAKSMGYREGDNPATWRGHLENTLPSPGKIQRVQHQRALRYQDAPELWLALSEVKTNAARALRLTMLCATRTGETLGATWDEVDLERGHWAIPAERMKAGKPHRIPLSTRAVKLLADQKQRARDQWVFPGQKRGAHLSEMAMSNVLKRLDWLGRTTVHGLRSTFRDWVSEQTNFDDRLAEIALAHQLSDRVQAAYNRSDLFEKRRVMMSRWAEFLVGSDEKVVELRPVTTA